MTIQNDNSFIKWKNQKLKHIKGMENNCHIPDLLHAFPYVENYKLNLFVINCHFVNPNLK